MNSAVKAPPATRPHSTSRRLFVNQVSVTILGQPTDWSTNRIFPHGVDMLRNAVAETPNKLLVLRDGTNSGTIIDASRATGLGKRIRPSRKRIIYDIPVDDILLPQGSGLFLATNDYPILIALNLTTKSVGVVRTSLPLLTRYPKDDPRRAPERQTMSVLSALFSAFDEELRARNQARRSKWPENFPVLRTWIIGGVWPQHLTFPFDDPKWGKHNQEIIRSIEAQWGTSCLSTDRQGHQGVSVHHLIARQLNDHPWTQWHLQNPNIDSACFHGDKDELCQKPCWHSFLRDKRKNGVLVWNRR